MIIMFFLYKTTASKYLIQKISKEHRQAMSAIDARAREDINNVHMVMHLVMLAHVLKTSLVLGPVFQLLILVVKFCFKNSDKYWRRFISKDRGYWRALDAEVRQVYV